MSMRFYVLIACLLVASVLRGENVDLVTLPRRNTVQLTIYNSEDLTLAKETRRITLKKGNNRIQFSWAGTLIDPSSVYIRPMEHQDEIDVVDTVYPGQKPSHLIWNINSDVEAEVAMEVSYFTSGLTWQMDYVGISDPEEKVLNFRGYVRVFNNSGEEYEDAQIRLVVGKVNLVEKIAELAKNRGVPVPSEETTERSSMRLDVLRKLSETVAETSPAKKPAKIVKEGLSEYFIFTVAGEETIKHGWSKRMQAVRADEVKFDVVYRLRSYQYGPRPVRFFVWNNNEAHGLGDSPLPNGMLRLFRRNEQDGLGYLGQQRVNYVPVQAKVEVNLGSDDLVVQTPSRTATKRTDFLFHPKTKNVTGWDEHQSWNIAIRNYHDKPIRIELRLRLGGDVEVTAPKAKSFDYNTIEVVQDVKESSQTDYRYDATIHQGNRAKQNRVRLKPDN